jgi:hypothetical protein
VNTNFGSAKMFHRDCIQNSKWFKKKEKIFQSQLPIQKSLKSEEIQNHSIAFKISIHLRTSKGVLGVKKEYIKISIISKNILKC